MATKTRERSFLQIFHTAAQGHAAEITEPAGDDLLDLVPVDSPAPDLRSPAQANLMDRLINEIRETDPAAAAQADEYMIKMEGRWTPGREGNASRWISRLIAKADELKKVRRGAGRVALEDGMYLLDGEIFKVQHAVHGSGNQYAKRLVVNGEGEKATFAYAPGVVTRLRPEHRMNLEQAKQYGALYGVCVRCGTVLTREESIERAMGPVCAGKI
jgi:hypothetical protein